MKPIVWFRISAVLLLLFAAGHTFGFLTFRAPTLEGQAVFTSMNSVHFSDGRWTYSYGNFYTGFGLFITFAQLFCAWLAWQLGAWARAGITEAATAAWGLCVLQLISFPLSVHYFSLPPAIFSLLTAITFACAAISTRRRITSGTPSL
jgi:hypothetical protein